MLPQYMNKPRVPVTPRLGAYTVTKTLAVLLERGVGAEPSAVTLISAVPGLTPVITPVGVTVTTRGLEDDQVTVFTVAFLGSTDATNVVCAATISFMDALLFNETLVT
jgi:hypothetical protein